MEDFYDSVYSQDNPEGESHGWIQWKNSDVCVDMYCSCGHHSHYDGEFLYFYECPKCHSKYAVGQNIKLIPLNDEQIEHIEHNAYAFFQTETDESCLT